MDIDLNGLLNEINLKDFMIIDSTLREGHQTVHPAHSDRAVVFSKDQQLNIARALCDFGVDYIEVLTPVRSPALLSIVKDIVSITKNEKTGVLAHCRCKIEDVEAALDAGVDGCNFYFNYSDTRDLEKEDVLASIMEVLTYLEDRVDGSFIRRFSFEDAFRTSDHSVQDILPEIASHISRVGFPDTTGTAFPDVVFSRISTFRKQYPELSIEVHFHDDIGLAPANALFSLAAGARIFSVCVLGLGERTGLLALSSLIGVLSKNEKTLEFIKQKYDLAKLPVLSSLVANALEIKIPYKLPIVGPAAFSHVAGVHVNAQLRNDIIYQSIDPSTYGRISDVCIASSVVGKASILFRAEQLDITLDPEAARKIADEIREQARIQGFINLAQIDARIKDAKTITNN